MNWFKERGFLWWLRLVGMGSITVFNTALSLIRWGINAADHLVQSDALLLAAGSEVILGVALWLFGEQMYSDERGWKNAGWWVKLVWWLARC